MKLHNMTTYNVTSYFGTLAELVEKKLGGVDNIPFIGFKTLYNWFFYLQESMEKDAYDKYLFVQQSNECGIYDLILSLNNGYFVETGLKDKNYFGATLAPLNLYNEVMLKDLREYARSIVSRNKLDMRLETAQTPEEEKFRRLYHLLDTEGKLDACPEQYPSTYRILSTLALSSMFCIGGIVNNFEKYCLEVKKITDNFFGFNLYEKKTFSNMLDSYIDMIKKPNESNKYKMLIQMNGEVIPGIIKGFYSKANQLLEDTRIREACLAFFSNDISAFHDIMENREVVRWREIDIVPF